MKKLAVLRAALLAAFAFFAATFLPIGAAEAASRFAVCTTACTWDGSNTAMWAATSGGATGQSVPGSADTVTLDANTCVGGTTCTITVNTTVNISSLTLGACTASTTGCILDFSVNNNNVTLSASAAAFSGSGTGTRNLKMGNGTWSLTGGGSWNMTTTTNLTFSANSSTLSFTAPSGGPQTFTSGGLTYNNVTFTASKGGYVINNAATISGTLSAAAPTNLYFPSATTVTVGSFSFTGGSSTNQIGVQSGSNSAAATISSATSPTMAWMAFRGVTFTGGGTFNATSSFDLGFNTGVTISGPSGGSSPSLRPGIG